MKIRDLLRLPSDTCLLEVDWGETLVEFINDTALPDPPVDITMTLADVLKILRKVEQPIKLSILNTVIDLDLLEIDDSNTLKVKPLEQTKFGRRFIALSTALTMFMLFLIISNLSIASSGDVDYSLLHEVLSWVGDLMGLTQK